MVILSTGAPAPDAVIRFLDASSVKIPSAKSKALADSEVASVAQARQLDNPDKRVSPEELGSGELLETVACSIEGLHTGDTPRMRLHFWEFDVPDDRWIHFRGTVNDSIHFGGMIYLLRWGGGKGAIDELPGARKQGLEAWNKRGVIVSCMRELPVSLHVGCAFNHGAQIIIPNNESELLPVWCFCSSPEYNKAVRVLDQKLSITVATLVKVSFDIERWTQVANEQYPHGLPNPYSDDPVQWIFHGHPCGSVIWDDNAKRVAHGPLRTDATVLQLAVARLLGYRWPAELDVDMELADEQREWVRRCEDLAGLVDRDGIVVIPAVTGEANAADRLLDMLIASYGDDWSNGVLTRLLAASDNPNGTLESWLRDKFFAQHCKLFKDRPFIWQIWDGLRDGFSALVNYHKLNYNLLYSLTFNYLRDWIARQRYDLKNNVEGAERRMIAAENLRHRLKAILWGEAPYDIFVRWKPLEEQPIGWHPDINDGVRLNIRPFMTEHDSGDDAKKGVCILRHRLNVKWDKDRGKDAETAPWYHVDKGDRINDRHLRLEEKEKARS
jgi:hypothetical protein